MTPQQLQTLEAELKKRGYIKYTRCLTDDETYAWFKSFDKKKDDDGEIISGFQIAFRVWDNSAFCYRHNLNEDCAYGFDFWTSPIDTDSRMDFTSNWEPICNFGTFEKMAREFNEFVRKYDNGKNSEQ